MMSILIGDAGPANGSVQTLQTSRSLDNCQRPIVGNIAQGVWIGKRLGQIPLEFVAVPECHSKSSGQSTGAGGS